jgi:hypothetical protein
VAALRSAGCAEQRIALPPRTPSDAPPITTDELLDMWEALQRPGWEREVLASSADDLGDDGSVVRKNSSSRSERW